MGYFGREMYLKVNKKEVYVRVIYDNDSVLLNYQAFGMSFMKNNQSKSVSFNSKGSSSTQDKEQGFNSAMSGTGLLYFEPTHVQLRFADNKPFAFEVPKDLSAVTVIIDHKVNKLRVIIKDKLIYSHMVTIPELYPEESL